jgi:hypothetical protein
LTIYLTPARDNKHFKGHLRIFTVILIGSIIVSVSLVILSKPENRKAVDLVVLDITGVVAVTLGLIVIYRQKFHGPYGKPFFCLSMGVLFLLAGDIAVSYYYFILLIKDVPPTVSFADVLWLVGYVFFALHLFMMLKIVREKINTAVVVGTSIASATFVAYTITAHVPLISSEFAHQSYSVFAVNISYPVADAILIIPAVAVLVAHRSDFEHSIPMTLASLSLLINALADYGFVNDVMNNNTGNKWIWDLFFISDFLIIAAALYWYNRYYVTRSLTDRKDISL